MTFKIRPLFFAASCAVVIMLLGCKTTNENPKVETNVSNDSIYNSIRAVVAYNPDSALSLALSYQDTFQVKEDSIFYYEMEHLKGESYYYKGKVDTALLLMTNTLNYWKRKRHNRKLALSFYNLGYLYNQQNNYEKSLEYTRQAQRIARQEDFHAVLISSYFSLRKLYSGTNNYNQALLAIDSCMHLCADIKDTTSMVLALQAYVELYSDCYYFDEAEKQLSELKTYKDYFSDYDLFSCYNSEGRMYYLWGKNEEAKVAFENALNYTTPADIVSYLIVNSNLAEISLYLTHLDDAKMYLDTLKKYEHILRQLPLFYFNYNSLLADYSNQTNNSKKAGLLFAEADNIAKSITVEKVLYQLHLRRKINYLESIGQYQSAFNLLQHYNGLVKETQEEADRKQVASLKYSFSRDTTVLNQRYELTKNKAEIKSFKRERFLFTTILLVILGLGIFAILFFRKKRELREIENLNKLSKLRIQNARNSMSPHFFFNILGSFNHILEQPKVLRTRLEQLSILLRKVVENIDHTVVPLEKELEAVKAYISIQQGALPVKFDVDYHISDKLDMTHLVPAMGLQTPIENAIKHGLVPKDGERNLSLSIEQFENYLHIVVKDTGVGLKNSVPSTRGTGSGIRVLHNTIEVLNRYNHRKISFDISDRGNGIGTKVSLKIPIPLYSDEIDSTI